MFRVLSGIDFMQKSYGEYYTLPQTTCTRNTLNFVNIKNEFVKIYLSYGISFIEALGESIRKVLAVSIRMQDHITQVTA